MKVNATTLSVTQSKMKLWIGCKNKNGTVQDLHIQNLHSCRTGLLAEGAIFGCWLNIISDRR